MTRVEHDPLRIEFTFPDGDSWTANLAATPNPRLTEDLAHALVQMVHPLGGVARRHTAEDYSSALRRMVAELTADGFDGGVGDLTKSGMLRYWLASSPERVRNTRMLLRACGEKVEPELRAYLEGRPVKRPRQQGTYQPYSEDHWRAIESGLRSRAVDLLSAHRNALELAALGPDGTNLGRNKQNYAWLLLEHGPLKLADLADMLGLSTGAFRKNISAGYLEIRRALYPPIHDVYAVRTLFSVYSGVVPDGVRDLGLDDFAWAGEHTVLMDYVKRRRGPESTTLPARAVRLLERWLELSAPMRRFAPPQATNDLWIYADEAGTAGALDKRIPVQSTRLAQEAGGNARRRLSKELDLRDEDGSPVGLHAGRIRVSYHNALARKGWTGRTRIDPNHTAAVEGSHYVSSTTPAQTESVEAIIEDAQADVLRQARPPIVLSDEQAADFAAGWPEEAARLGVDEGTWAELLAGEMDVFTAACSNQLAGLHGPKGKPCPARPWVCLLCPLAVFTPRHAPNLLRLKAYFARQSRQMMVEQFLAVFGPYADRLDHDILPRFGAHVLQAASGEVADTDAELPLRPEEASL
ncbi:hypothetical protein AB0E96_01015 [Kitasatospora sp. NPDC036755]|uniref:hypothetical protein n=1 Tax=Kitasatospora sp. NPDC036755 TaxID=3154600 RepID=UPI0033E4F74B